MKLIRSAITIEDIQRPRDKFRSVNENAPSAGTERIDRIGNCHSGLKDGIIFSSKIAILVALSSQRYTIHNIPALEGGREGGREGEGGWGEGGRTWSLYSSICVLLQVRTRVSYLGGEPDKGSSSFLQERRRQFLLLMVISCSVSSQVRIMFCPLHKLAQLEVRRTFPTISASADCVLYKVTIL